MKAGGLIVGASMFGVICYLVLILVLITGWVMNLVSLCSCDFEHPYKAEVIRSIGVLVPPVGGVAGYINIDDGVPNHDQTD